MRTMVTPLTSTVFLTDIIPGGLICIPESIWVSHGEVDYADRVIRWNGVLSATPAVTLTYAVVVEEAEVPRSIANTARIDAGEYGVLTRTSTVIVDAYKFHLPVVLRRWE